MDYSDRSFTSGKDNKPGPPRIGVFVSQRQAADLTEQADPTARVLLMIRAVTREEAIPTDRLDGLAGLVIEVDPASPRSVARLEQIVRSRPAFPVIAAISAPDISLVRTLVREGVSGVLGLPLSVPEITQACLDSVARAAQPVSRITPAPLICVVRSSGGSGATTVATHLASDLATLAAGRRRVLLGDLDFQFGSVGSYLGMERSGSMLDLIAAEERLDEDLVHALAPTTDHDLAVLAIPDTVPSLDSIPHDGLLRVVATLRANFGIVVLDLPANWSNWSASIGYAADLILLVTELSLPSIRQARRCIDLFDAIGIPGPRIEIVANKVDRKLFRPIDTGDLASSLGRPVLASLPRDPGELERAQNQGVLVGSLTRRNPFAGAVRELAQAVLRKLGLEDVR